MYEEIISPRFYNRKSEKYGDYKVIEQIGTRGKTKVPYFLVKFKDTGNEIESPVNTIINNKVIDSGKKKTQTKKRRTEKKKDEVAEKRVSTFKSEVIVPENYKMIVLDISSCSVGWSEFANDELTDFGNFSISKKTEPRTIVRLNDICLKTIRLLQERNPNIVIVENVLQKTKRVLYALAMGHGIILNYLVANGIEFRRVDVNAWKYHCNIIELKKKQVGTDRQKTKLATIDFVDTKFRLNIMGMEYDDVEKEVGAWEDRADAIAIGCYAKDRLIKH